MPSPLPKEDNGKSDYFLMRFSYAPKRYGLVKNNEKVISFGTKALRKCFPNILPSLFDSEKGQLVYLTADDFLQLKTEEDKSLREEMVAYLATDEKSPRELQVWLSRRDVHGKKAKVFQQFATLNQFLDPLRFAISFVRRKINNPWPWWSVRKQLLSHGVPSEEVDSFVFEDRDVLYAYYENYRFKNPSKQLTQLRSKLISRGFQSEMVKELIAHLRAKQLCDDKKEENSFDAED